MATTLVYTKSPFVPFTKILSADVNQYFKDISNRLNWLGGTDTTTGLSGDNIQANSILETAATLTLQGVTYTANSGFGANGNNITIAYTTGAVAGQEIVSVVGSAITIEVQSGVSTVTQVVAALNLSPIALKYITPSGVSSSTITAVSATNLAGGVNSGGLVRSLKLSLDSANFVLINDSTGKMSSEPALSISRGGTGIIANFTETNPGDVFQVNSTNNGIVLSAPSGVPASLRIFQFQNFT